MFQLPRVPQTSLKFERKDYAGRFAEITAMLDNLAADMPTEIDLESLFNISLLPPRVASAREALRYRMVELSRSACDCFTKTHGVAGAVLTRAAFETSALLFSLDKRIRRAVNDNKLEDIGVFLLKVVVPGKNNPKLPDSINVLTLVEKFDKQYSGWGEQYMELCEVAHPNQMGTLVPYSDSTPKKITFAPKTDYGCIFYNTLLAALTVFETHYNNLAGYFDRFFELCRRDAPRDPTAERNARASS